MSQATIFHNPNCSKSRETLALLQAQGVTVRIVDYLKTPPDAQELARILDLLGLQARELMRKGDAAFRELGLDDPALSGAQLIQAMVDQPRLIERPIVLANGKAALGRPPSTVLDIL